MTAAAEEVKVMEEPPNSRDCILATAAAAVPVDSSLSPSSSSRIPQALQQVFLESNQGHCVPMPPVCGVASKTFSIRDRLCRLNSGIFRSDSFRSLFGRNDSNKSLRVMNHSNDDDCGHTTFTDSSSTCSRHDFHGAAFVVEPKSPVSFPNSSNHSSSHLMTPRNTIWNNNNDNNNIIKNDEMPLSPSVVVAAVCSSSSSCSPQTFLDSLLASRGYSTQRYPTLQTAYTNKPTALQLASYNVYLIQLLKQDDVETFRSVITSGISQNPCNKYGESLVHTVCRRGAYDFLNIMITECQTCVQVSDDHGRTPLHDACWNNSPCFKTTKLLFDCDVSMLYLTDAHGATPLSYVRSTHWSTWIDFIQQHADLYWPVLLTNKETNDQNVQNHQPQQQQQQQHDSDGSMIQMQLPPPPTTPPPRTQQEPNSRPIPDPKLALTLEMATLVSAGKITPVQAEYFCSISHRDSDDEDDDDDDMMSDDSDSNSDSNNDDDDDDDDSSSYCSISSDSSALSWDEQEMAEIMQSLSSPKAQLNAAPASIVWSP